MLNGPGDPLRDCVIGTDAMVIQDLSDQDLAVGSHPVGHSPSSATRTTDNPGAVGAMTVPIQDVLTCHEGRRSHDLRHPSVLHGNSRVENRNPDASPREVTPAGVDSQHGQTPVLRCEAVAAAPMDGTTSDADNLMTGHRRFARGGYQVRWEPPNFIRNDANSSNPLDTVTGSRVEIQRSDPQSWKQPDQRLHTFANA